MAIAFAQALWFFLDKQFYLKEDQVSDAVCLVAGMVSAASSIRFNSLNNRH